MSVDPRISLSIVAREIEDSQRDASLFKWEISGIDEQNQSFTVKMKSPIDQEEYIMEIKFDNYKEWPLLIEFIDPKTLVKGTKNAYPSDQGSPNGNLFHGHPCICHPCSRKAHNGYGNVHTEWNLVGWQQLNAGSLTTIQAILRAIYFRISNPVNYKGRMHA